MTEIANAAPYPIEEINQAQLLKMLNKAKVNLMMKGSVFLSTILFSLKLQWNESIHTAGVDGINLFINPHFFISLTKDQRVFLMAHEAWHVAFDHITRGKNYKHKKYNYAADFVINLPLKNEGYSVIPGALIDKKYKDMTTEQVYDLLPDPPPDFICDIMPGTGDPKKDKEIKNHIEGVLVRATTQSKLNGDKPGTIPGEIEFYIENLINPVLPWNIILQNYMTEFKKDDYTWTRPNRRYVSQGLYLPIQHSEALQNIAVAVDASYSVSDDDFTMFISEIEDIRVTHQPDKVTIVDFDTRIKNIHELNQDDEIREINFSGRGGTDLYPVFDHFNAEPPSLLIVFSDLQCTPIKDETEYPVIWVCVNSPGGAVNFGHLIHIKT